jgi:hypothetical protein
LLYVKKDNSTLIIVNTGESSSLDFRRGNDQARRALDNRSRIRLVSGQPTTSAPRTVSPRCKAGARGGRSPGARMNLFGAGLRPRPPCDRRSPPPFRGQRPTNHERSLHRFPPLHSRGQGGWWLLTRRAYNSNPCGSGDYRSCINFPQIRRSGIQRLPPASRRHGPRRHHCVEQQSSATGPLSNSLWPSSGELGSRTSTTTERS